MKTTYLLCIAMLSLSIGVANGSEKKEMARIAEPVAQKPVVQKSTTQKSTTQKSTTQKSTTQKSTLDPAAVKRVQNRAKDSAETIANIYYSCGAFPSGNLDNEIKSSFQIQYGLPRDARDKQFYEVYKKAYKEHFYKSLKILQDM